MNKQFSVESDLFGERDRPAGFVYRDNVISRAEETELLESFSVLPFKPFEFRGFLGNRRVVSFGWRYDFSGRALRESDPPPDFLLALRAKAADFSGVPEAELQQMSVSEYSPGAGIGWHRDKANFKDVVAFSFASPCKLRFRREAGTAWERKSIQVQPRSAYLLRGEVRDLWSHSIPPVDRLRYSVTFRNFADSKQPG